MRARALALAALLMSACAVPQDAARLNDAVSPLPVAQIFDPGAPRALPAARANRDMVRDFMELGFRMESGRPIPQFSRYEGPVLVVLNGSVPARAQIDLDRLIARLRNEAGIDIARAPGNRTEPGQNTLAIEFLTQNEMRRAVPNAACFVVPNVTSWSEFTANRRSPSIDWTRVAQRRQTAVFIPIDTTPQEIRDCLHEEVAQALGPLNDLYRLPDSVFNDDNFQTTLTGFDMLILRAWHAPELAPGMAPEAVAARLPAILDRLNPAGRRPGAPDPGPTPRDWIEAIETTLGAGASTAQRRAASQRAVQIAGGEGWRGPRLALSLFLAARLATRDEGNAAFSALLAAGEIYRRLPGGEVHAAHVDMHMAVQALAAGQYDLVVTLTERARPYANRTENAAFQASLAFLQAEALEQRGEATRAARLRIDSLPAARYGFGSPAAVQARLDEVVRLGAFSRRLAAVE
ncbi:DUF2927 domain-containing protein [Pararhodobacter sp. SW119]|uniref:DUF2927 domain-containing protein n=1 Tax=Pararhodobacter sp. SW119 TaxID=2780075 RepID=UPI001ADFF698|nr:DUF2927 domain-containing protein [Pararhodobacter sp. SW119]